MSWRPPPATRAWALACALTLAAAVPLEGQDLDPADVRVGLDFLKADPGGLHWQVQWLERAFPHHRWLVVLVYMDGHVGSERIGPSGAPARHGD